MWTSIASKYELRPDECAVLENACAATDMIAALTKVWTEAGCPTITSGSMGQEVIHPLVGEIRAQRAYRDASLARLKLPDMPGEGERGKPAEDASAKARKAAVARWSRGA